MLKKIILYLSISVFLLVNSLLFFVPKANAQTTSGQWYLQSFPQWYTKVYDTNTSPPNEIFGERYTAAQVQWVIYGLIAFLMNIDGNSDRQVCLFTNDLTTCYHAFPFHLPGTGYAPNAPAGNRSIFATLFSPERSMSGVKYTLKKLTDLHIIPEAKAQGFGFAALNPILTIWKTIRDITYGLFVIVIIIFAFMIMFRVRLSPQTVVTVQSALPKIAITLILITFSYAIAGFMIDLAYVAIGLVALLFSSTGLFGSGSWNNLFDLITTGVNRQGIFGWAYVFMTAYWSALIASIYGITGFGGIGASVVVGILGIILFICLTVWGAISIVKIVFLLLKTYLLVFISVVFSPLLIAFGAITPTGGFNSWIRNLLANLAVYPIAGAIILLSVFFLAGTFDGVRDSLHDSTGLTITNIFGAQPGTTFWYPPLTVGQQHDNFDPLPFLWLVASLGVLAILPSVAELGKSLMSGEAFAYGTAIGVALGEAWSQGNRWGVGPAGGFLQRNIVDRALLGAARRAYTTEEGRPVATGIRGAVYRGLTGYGVRTGRLEVPSPQHIRRRSTYP